VVLLQKIIIFFMELPFELVVSVVLMGMILMIGYYLIDKFWKGWMFESWKTTDNAIVKKIERIANSGDLSETTFPLKYEGCPECTHILSFEKINNQKYCTKICGKYMNSCWVLKHSALDRHKEQIFGLTLCIKIVSEIKNPEGKNEFVFRGIKKIGLKIWKKEGDIWVSK